MQVIIEATSEYGIAKRVWLRPGERIAVGRTERSDLVLTSDPQLADLHFTIGCDGQNCQLRDLNTATGTFLNGSQVAESIVRDQDVIVAGGTTFHVHIKGAPSEPPSAERDHTDRDNISNAATVAQSRDSLLHSVGNWGFDCIPDQWEAVNGVGVRWLAPDHEPGVVSVAESELGDFVDFTSYVGFLLNRLIQPALGLERAAPTLISIAGADHALECQLRFPGPKGESVVQRQLFAHSGNLLGTAAFMTQEVLADELSTAFQRIHDGMSFCAFATTSPSEPGELQPACT